MTRLHKALLLLLSLVLIRCGTEVGNPGDDNNPVESRTQSPEEVPSSDTEGGETPAEANDQNLPKNSPEGGRAPSCGFAVQLDENTNAKAGVFSWTTTEGLELWVQGPEDEEAILYTEHVELMVGSWTFVLYENDKQMCELIEVFDEEDLEKVWILIDLSTTE